MAAKAPATPSPSECVKVMVRVRPMNSSEKSKGCENITLVEAEHNQITLKRPEGSKEPPKLFAFDAVFAIETTQRTIYEDSAFPLIESVIEGYNGTIFAYGQTGCGKTFTMLGPKKNVDKDLRGIIPNAFTHIFESISSFGKERRFLLRCSYLEIYNENVNDLLQYNEEQKLELKEDPQKGVYVKGLKTVIVKSVADIEKTMTDGGENRHFAETSMNKDSSRSHCIFTIYIETAETKSDGTELLRAGKLNLVDLAGSERQAKTHAEGMRLKEAAKINLSLSALGNVISALVDGKSSHIPYRDSKLTRLLQDSLGGNTKTVMIACVSPADYNYDETLSTLRYASRAKNIQNKPRINEDPKDALLRQYEDEIKSLRDMIGKLSQGGAVTEQIKELEMVHRHKSNELNGIVESPEDLIASPKTSGKVKQLEEEKESLNKDKQKVEEELKQREAEFLSEKVQRENLESMLKQLERKLLVGGDELEERQKEQTQKYKVMQAKLRKQRVKEKKLWEEHKKKEEERQMVELQYKDVQEELDAKTQLVEGLKAKHESALSEIKDLQREHQDEKETLLDTIRDQNQEIDFYKKIIEIMLSDNELERVRNKATWDDESKLWTIPLFMVQNKQITLPKLPKAQVTELIENEKKTRVLVFQKDPGPSPTKVQIASSMPSVVDAIANAKNKQSGSTVHKNYAGKKESGGNYLGPHLFNWEILGKSKKYAAENMGSRQTKTNDSSPTATFRKNPKLDSLQYNPMLNLPPVNDEELRSMSQPPAQSQVPQKKKKVLTKIDTAQLSAAARVQKNEGVGAVKPKKSLTRLPFANFDDN